MALKDGWRHPFHPSFTIALATGVGKTRLAGAIMAFLWLAREAQTFLILAPRRAVLRRFESALDLRFREYIFIDPNLVPEPSVVRGDEIDSPRAFEFEGDLLSKGPKIFLLSPQLIASSERFTRCPSYSDRSPQEALRDRRDLVVIADEAHHIGKLSSKETTAWAGAIRQLAPALHIGLTATPRREPGEHLLYEYSLQRALRAELYTKAVHICVRQFSGALLDADDIDKSAIQYSLDRLDRKTAESEAAVASGFPRTKPVCVFFARDIEHASQVQEWILATGRVFAEELLVTHSRMSKSEDELERLLSIESADNPVRVVVNVMELTEGWDVTNVYVVTPLRAMATFQGALQAMGRGLRLPAGIRTGNPILDELDVVCFGKEALERIVREATEWVGVTADGTGVKVTTFDKADPVLVRVPINAVRAGTLEYLKCDYVAEELKLVIDSSALSKVTKAVVTEIELAAAKRRLGFGNPRIARDRFIRATALRVIRALGRYLSDAKNLTDVENLVSEWLDGVRPEATEIEFDPAEVGQEIADVLEAGARLKSAAYVMQDGIEVVSFPGYDGQQEVMIGPGESLPTMEPSDLMAYDGSSFEARRLYRGWSNALHEACSFDAEPEAKLALLLDQSPEVIWWVRNNPVRFQISTPAGRYQPDFVVRRRLPAGEGHLLLEAKGDHLWVAPTMDARLKSAAAKEWAAAQQRAGVAICSGIALESDIRRSGSWSELATKLQ